MLKRHFDRKLRERLVRQAGFSADETLLACRFINGDDSAILELGQFREWKRKREKERALSTLSDFFQPKV